MHHTRKIAVIGLGYVGLSVAFASSGVSVIDFDIHHKRVDDCARAPTGTMPASLAPRAPAQWGCACIGPSQYQGGCLSPGGWPRKNLLRVGENGRVWETENVGNQTRDSAIRGTRIENAQNQCGLFGLRLPPMAGGIGMASTLKTPRARPVLVFLVTEDWYFLSHRLPMAREARRVGYDVHVVTRVNKGGAAIEAEGFRLHSVVWQREHQPVRVFLQYPGCAPALSRHPARYRAPRGVAAHHRRLAGRRRSIQHAAECFGWSRLFVCVVDIEGAAGAANPSRAAAVRLRHPRAAVLVQNPDDRPTVRSLGVGDDRIFMIPGSGVETDALTPLPEPVGPKTAAFVGRLLDDKGVRTLVNAHEILVRRGQPVRLLIAGDPDPADPGSIPAEEIAAWAAAPEWDCWATWSISVRCGRPPHRRAALAKRGLPQGLLEAAACGRPIVATVVPAAARSRGRASMRCWCRRRSAGLGRRHG